MKRISLETARQCANLEEELVCTAMGIDEYTLDDWEDGTKFPTVEQAFTLSKLYGMPIDLIGFTKKDNRAIYDYTALRKQILKRFESIEAFARVIEMKPSILKSRLNMKTEFTYDELTRIREELQLSGSELRECFFTRYYSLLIPICNLIRKLPADEYDLLLKLIAHGYKGPNLEGE